MTQGKFSQPRNRNHPDNFQENRFEEDGIIPAELSENPHFESEQSRDMDALLNSADAAGENSEFSKSEPGSGPLQSKDAVQGNESYPSVYNQDTPGEDSYYQLLQAEGDNEKDTVPLFTERIMEFFDDHRRSVTLGLCAVVGVLLACIILAVFINANSSKNDPYGGKILNNVTIAGIDVGGMTRSEAIRSVKEATSGTFTKKDMIVLFSEETLILSPSDTKAKLDVAEAVDAAYNYGRTGTKAEQQKAYQSSLTDTHTIALLPYLELDTDYIFDALNKYVGRYAGQFTQSAYILEGEKPDLTTEGFDEDFPCQTLVLTLGTPGFGLDIQELYNKILDAYSMNTFLVEVGDVPENAIPNPLDLDAIYEEIYVAPVNASLDKTTYEVIPGTYGYDFDLEAAKVLLEDAGYGDTVRISLRYLEPEKAENILYRDVLGSCETPHTSNENRNTNLRIVCQTLNGMVINPGDTFSYNEALGQRTAEKGYLKAPAYSGQTLVDSIGGGICQGSSTLYYCALLADLQIVERTNHGFPASYIDLGMDATVNWGSPDLKFKNNTDYPIKIEAEVSDGYVKMKILGTDTKNYYIKMEYEVTGTQEPETVYEEHKSGEGYTDGQVLQSGKNAIYVKTYKLKYDKQSNKLISKDFEARSTYQSRAEIVVRLIPDTTTEPTTVPTEESTEPATEPSAPTDPTAPATEPSAPTEPSAQSTETTETSGTQPAADAVPVPAVDGIVS